MENLITVTIRSTHYYLIDIGQGYFMVDAGWAGELPALKSQLKRFGVELGQIRYVMITHHHPDHAGLAQEIKQASGARLVILKKQIPFLEKMGAGLRPAPTTNPGKGEFVPIRVEAGDLVLDSSNRAALQGIGVRGEIVETPGHSDDSVSLALDSGLAFIGDLHPPDYVTDEAREVTRQSWRKLVKLKVRRVYPAHGEPFPMEAVRVEEEG